MTQIAQMRFASLSRPEAHGLLVLHDDGALQVVPSDAMRDGLSDLEEAALRRAHLFGTSLGLGLVTLGLLAIGAGWAYGRIFGRLGYTLSRPRPLDAVSLSRADGGGVHLTMRGTSRLHSIQLAWNANEISPAEAEAFLAKCEELRTRH